MSKANSSDLEAAANGAYVNMDDADTLTKKTLNVGRDSIEARDTKSCDFGDVGALVTDKIRGPQEINQPAPTLTSSNSELPGSSLSKHKQRQRQVEEKAQLRTMEAYQLKKQAENDSEFALQQGLAQERFLRSRLPKPVQFR